LIFASGLAKSPVKRCACPAKRNGKKPRGRNGLSYPWGNQKPDAACVIMLKPNWVRHRGWPLRLESISPYGVRTWLQCLEWTADWYAALSGEHTNDSNFGTKYRVLRGGSWDVIENFLVCPIASGTGRLQGLSSGFRCVASRS